MLNTIFKVLLNRKKVIAIQKILSTNFGAKYSLGNKYKNQYFTHRETECMLWLLQGKTINKIAKILAISPRTVEFYLKNMKAKVGCKSKLELVAKVQASDFLQNIK